jgi:hypothetical protein
MRREELAHILRAASQIADEQDVLVIGSQSILGAYDEDELPDAAVASVEADVAFFGDIDDVKADMVDGAMGEDSQFHSTFGYYAQGVSVTTAVLPDGWRDRLIRFEGESTKPGRGLCLDPHDLVISKLVAGREKDFEFCAAVMAAGLVQPDLLRERAASLPSVPAVRRRVQEWVVAREQVRLRRSTVSPPSHLPHDGSPPTRLQF